MATQPSARPDAREITQIRRARRRSLPQEIADQLLELIAAAGSSQYKLPPEKILCEQFGVSRTSLREALSALTHIGVLEIRGKAKFGVSGRARAQLLSLEPETVGERELITDPLEVRRMLEPEVAARAAERATDSDLDKIMVCLHEMESAAQNRKRVVEYDSRFHTAIARATGNHTLVQLVKALSNSLGDSRELSFTPQDAASLALDDHRAIVDALFAKDPTRARHAMRKHLDHVERLIRASIAFSAQDRPD
jgi:GntR family transcriptional repressor for pyruvate dehydrogenase complex